MNPDGFDDVRLLLHDADPGPLPELDVDRILRDGAGQRRRATRDRWLAAAAVVLVLASAGAGVAYLERPQQADPAAPTTPTSTRGTVPAPLTPEQWLLYAQVGMDEATSVRYVGVLDRPPGARPVAFELVLGRSTAQGTVKTEGASSRYISVDGSTYVEPAVLVSLGLVKASDVGSASWVRLGGQRFRLPTGVPGFGGVADASRFSPVFADDKPVDVKPTRAIATVYDYGTGTPGRRIFYLEADAPYRPVLVTLDGENVARFTDWNAPVSTPVAPPASEVVDIPGL